jgi:hypothetical protein
MITTRKVMFKVSPASLQTFIGTPECVLEDTTLTLTPSVIPNSNYFIMASDRNCLKYFGVFFCTVIIWCTETFCSPCTLHRIGWSSHAWFTTVNVRCLELHEAPNFAGAPQRVVGCCVNLVLGAQSVY